MIVHPKNLSSDVVNDLFISWIQNTLDLGN